MNRKTALATIRAEYAKHGEETIASTRAYIESQISYGAYMEAKRAGLWIHQEAQK